MFPELHIMNQLHFAKNFTKTQLNFRGIAPFGLTFLHMVGQVTKCTPSEFEIQSGAPE